VLRALGDALDELAEAGGDAEASGVRAAYLAASATVGRDVRLELPDGSAVQGHAGDVDADGALVVDGRPYRAGDVVHVR
jgi:BirA family biotin operon repressor/biotin-[acetyl-CoA-carboxylase] ligase